ncbi:hypothetical protein E4U55_007190 [Claviceps digitariae]|nr:hypothetical protein E4U55_007190 [Claviceps digitariae]
MQFSTILVALASVATVAATPKPEPSQAPLTFPQFMSCNGAGTAGDGSCEKQGLTTQCCSFVGDLTYFRTRLYCFGYSKNDKGQYSCANGGTPVCAYPPGHK